MRAFANRIPEGAVGFAEVMPSCGGNKDFDQLRKELSNQSCRLLHYMARMVRQQNPVALKAESVVGIARRGLGNRFQRGHGGVEVCSAEPAKFSRVAANLFGQHVR